MAAPDEVQRRDGTVAGATTRARPALASFAWWVLALCAAVKDVTIELVTLIVLGGSSSPAKAGGRFVPSSTLTGSPYWHLLDLVYRPWHWFHQWEVVNAGTHSAIPVAPPGAQAPNGPGILVVTMHSSNNFEFFLCIFGFARVTRRVVRALMHRVVGCLPCARAVGAVPGTRDIAVEGLRAGHIIGVVPGGTEEAMQGHEKAYELRWESVHGHRRRGFAHVAKAARARILPAFTINAEEARFNPVFSLWNLIGGSRLYDRIIRARVPVLSILVHVIGSTLWFPLSLVCGIPVPAKLTLVIGDDVVYDPDADTAEDIAQRTQDALRDLIAQYHPSMGTNYTRAVCQRFGWLPEQYPPHPAGESPLDAPVESLGVRAESAAPRRAPEHATAPVPAVASAVASQAAVKPHRAKRHRGPSARDCGASGTRQHPADVSPRVRRS